MNLIRSDLFYDINNNKNEIFAIHLQMNILKYRLTKIWKLGSDKALD